MGMTADVSFNMNGIAEILADHGLDRGGRVQQYVTTQLIGMFDSYVPFRSGTLKGSAVRNNSPPYEEIVYDGPYARRLYYNPQYTFNEAPRRGGYWDKRAWAAHKDTFLHNLQQAIRGGRLS